VRFEILIVLRMKITTVHTWHVICSYGMLHIGMKRVVHPAKLLYSYNLTTK